MNKSIEIMKLYELDFYLNCLMKYNTGNNNYYHNFNHILTVVKNIYFIAKNSNISDGKIRLMVIAGIFHDFNHTGGKSKNDKDNINASIEAFNNYTYENEKDNDFIRRLINVTEFPFKKDEILDIYEQIIRDSDLMQWLEDSFIQQSILGLNKELFDSNEITIKQLENQINFMKNIVIFTDYAKEIIETKIKNKYEDCEYLLEILKLYDKN